MAVVGTGALGRHHARILAEMPGVELAAVADSNLAAATETAARCRTRATADYRELIGQVAAVVVAVPTSLHATVAGDFLAAGADVFVEKPIAGSVREAQEIVSLADRHGAILQVGHVERYNPALVAARPFLGRPRYIRAERFAPFSFRSTDIGVVHDLMIHELDIVLDLVTAPVIDLQAIGTTIVTDHEDCVQARITFSDGTIADLAANRVSPVASRQMQVWGPDGCVHIDFAARQAVRYSPGPALRFGGTFAERAQKKGADIEKLRSEVFGSFIEVHHPAIVPCDQLTEELLAFTECIRRRSQPLVDGEIALKAMVIAERVLNRIADPCWGAYDADDIGARRLAG
jgi:predicted dehydrogenase